MTPTGTISADVDLKTLNNLISGLDGALLGTGAAPGDCQDILRVEAGLLAWDISEAIGPKNERAGRKGVDRDMNLKFFPLKLGAAKYEGSARSFQDKGKQGESSNFTWLFAYGKGSNLSLVGAKNEDIISESQMKSAFYGDALRGTKWKDLGAVSHPQSLNGSAKRRHARVGEIQHAVQINRRVVTPAAYKAFADKLKKKLGQARASFARTTRELLPNKAIKPFVLKQIPETISNGKSVFNDSQLKDTINPSISFGSNAKGMVSNPYVAAKISSAIEKRQKKVSEKLKKVLNGYAYNFATGGVYKQKTITEAE